MGLAPTTSTTMMLALGDALAVALMERRGFDRDQYKVFHPGGSLGQALLTVADLMHGRGHAAGQRNRADGGGHGHVGQALRLRQGWSTAAARLTGIVTDGDMRRRFGENLAGRPVAAVMTRPPRRSRPRPSPPKPSPAFRRIRSPRSSSPTRAAGRPVSSIHDCLKAGLS